MQPKLLRFLEQGEIMPVGETRPQRVDVRVIAATNADLEQRVTEGKFREDLYYRLSVIRIHVPPLRERREEIPHLAASSCAKRASGSASPTCELSSAVLDLFAQYLWPGNVRQLRNEIQRAVALSSPGSADHRRAPVAGDLAARPATAIPPPRTAVRGARPSPPRLAAAVEARRTGTDPLDARSDPRQHLRERPRARPHPPRPLSEAAPTRARAAGRDGYQLISQRVDWIVSILTSQLRLDPACYRIKLI